MGSLEIIYERLTVMRNKSIEVLYLEKHIFLKKAIINSRFPLEVLMLIIFYFTI